MKVIIGAGNQNWEGWVPTNKEDLDLLDEDTWKTYFGEKKADALLCEHVFEHLTFEEAKAAAKIIKKYLENSKGSNANYKDFADSWKIRRGQTQIIKILPVLVDAFPVTLDLPQDVSERSFGAPNAVAQHQKDFMSPTRRGFCSSDGSERFEFGICRSVFCKILGSVSETIIRIGISNCNDLRILPNSATPIGRLGRKVLRIRYAD